MTSMDMDVMYETTTSWSSGTCEGDETCRVEVTMHTDNMDGYEMAMEIELEGEEEFTEVFTPTMKRKSKKSPKNKSVTFNDDIEIIYIENCNVGRKVSEIGAPKQMVDPNRPAKGKLKLYRCATPNGVVFVEMDPCAAEYLSYVQREKNAGRNIIVKDFFKEAREFAEAQATGRMDCDNENDMDLYNASKNRYRAPRTNRKHHQAHQHQQPLQPPKGMCDDDNDSNSDPDMPSQEDREAEITAPSHSGTGFGHRERGERRRNNGNNLQKMPPKQASSNSSYINYSQDMQSLQSNWTFRPEARVFKPRQSYKPPQEISSLGGHVGGFPQPSQSQKGKRHGRPQQRFSSRPLK